MHLSEDSSPVTKLQLTVTKLTPHSNLTSLDSLGFFDRVTLASNSFSSSLTRCNGFELGLFLGWVNLDFLSSSSGCRVGQYWEEWSGWFPCILQNQFFGFGKVGLPNLSGCLPNSFFFLNSFFLLLLLSLFLKKIFMDVSFFYCYISLLLIQLNYGEQ